MSIRNNLSATTVAAYVVVVTAALVTGAIVGPVVWSAAATAEERPSVAVVTLRGPTNDANVNGVAEQLRAIRGNDSVEAVVLRVDSPGGPVDASEEFYLAVNRTASEMPVVAYVEGAAASGGYFGIVSADEIIVKPSSTVGSIGVIVQASPSVIEQAGRQQEQFVRSGPDKAQIGIDRIRTEMESLQRAFVGTVMYHRGDALSLDRTQVANGRAYLGGRAVENGFADRIGDLDTAIERAASRAEGIEGDEYDVYVTEPQASSPTLLLGNVSVQIEDGDGGTVGGEPEDEGQFQRPVKYYAVWGVPETNSSEVYIDG
ncbi:S49 family peptidase [Halomicroarcula sp. F27]|uniref:S49 family peptidase n=1 Tax=Haloarcula nitratireducens TaxID=2487749 RepID=A0AAW4P9V2_9EURY|nr:S49 family peptidase [Halomicroarcula nitratireducens]